MLNIQPLNLGYKLVADFLLLLLQILWQIVLIFVALIPCGSRLHPSLPCKTYPWRISPFYRHKCRCPCLSSRTTSCPTSIFYGTMRPRACHRPSTTTRGRCNRQTTTTTRPTRGLSSPAEPHLCPAALAARLEQHLRQLKTKGKVAEIRGLPSTNIELFKNGVLHTWVRSDICSVLFSVYFHTLVLLSSDSIVAVHSKSVIWHNMAS